MSVQPPPVEFEITIRARGKSVTLTRQQATNPLSGRPQESPLQALNAIVVDAKAWVRRNGEATR